MSKDFYLLERLSLNFAVIYRVLIRTPNRFVKCHLAWGTARSKRYST